jgi:hypothetical protein
MFWEKKHFRNAFSQEQSLISLFCFAISKQVRNKNTVNCFPEYEKKMDAAKSFGIVDNALLQTVDLSSLNTD